MSDHTQRPADPSNAETEELDTEGHAASWKMAVDPKTGSRTLRQEWTPDEPAQAGQPGRVTSPHRPKTR